LAVEQPSGPRLALVALAFVAAAFGWMAGGWRLLPPDSETLAVRAAAEGAIRTLSLDVSPPADYQGGPLSLADAASMKTRLVADITTYLAEPLQTRYTTALLAYVDQIGTGIWDSGDLSIDWDRALIGLDRASIAFSEHLTVLRHDNSVADKGAWTLDSTWRDQMTLVRQDGRWRVDTYGSECLAGCP
jgi:hypothetical protein